MIVEIMLISMFTFFVGLILGIKAGQWVKK